MALSINLMTSATAPKLTYAKIGNKSKRVQAVSTQLLRGREESQDLFSQMNQDNLNYIKKQLKLKKNRSEHDKSRSNNQEGEALTEQITQRDKIYHKYNKGEEEVSEREPYLEDTERKSSEDKPHSQLAEEVEDDYAHLMRNGGDGHDERGGLTTSQKGEQRQALTRIPESKMYHSLPYEQPKKRVVSIEGYFRESVSTNLQKYREDGNQFIEFLEDYISDLNHSKHIKTRTHEEDSSLGKKTAERAPERPPEKERERVVDRERVADREREREREGRGQSEQSQQRVREDFKKIDRLKRNSDTFGEPNSKYTVHSVSYESANTPDLEYQLKRERYNCIVMAKDLQTLRESLLAKDSVIKELRMQNLLLEEEITHLRTKQEIILKSKGENYDTRPLHYDARPLRPRHPKANDESLAGGLDSAYSNQFILSHQRTGSVNPSARRPGYSSRDNPPAPAHAPEDDFNQALFKQFENSSKAGTPRKERSIERIEKEFSSFMQQSGLNRRGRKVQYK